MKKQKKGKKRLRRERKNLERKKGGKGQISGKKLGVLLKKIEKETREKKLWENYLTKV